MQAPQHGSKDKNVIFFASGNISMNIFLPKTGYQQGNPSNIPKILGKVTDLSVKKKNHHTT